MTFSPFASLAELSALLAAGKTTSREITAFYLDRIRRLNSGLHAFCDVYYESALEEADIADEERAAGRLRSPLHGLPIAVKDLFEIERQLTAAGSACWAGRRSTLTAPVVEKLRAAGMIILGKTHMVEFAFGVWGTNPLLGAPKNPWDLATHRVPGGSSSGSGVAVAAGLAPAAMGSDTGGSVRIPASLNGITGLKTTSGLISIHGVIPLAATLDTIGPLTRTIEDAALLTALLAGEDPDDSKTKGAVIPDFSAVLKSGKDLSGITIAALPEADMPEITDAETVAVWREAKVVLARLGARIVERALPFSVEHLTRSNVELTSAECYQNHGHLAEDPSSPMGDGVRARTLGGKAFQGEIYHAALDAHEKAALAFKNWIGQNEAVLTPSVPFPAIPLSEVNEKTPWMALFSRAGNFLRGASVSLPAGFSKSGLPIGIMLTSGPFREDLLIRLGRAWQQETDWHRKTPRL